MEAPVLQLTPVPAYSNRATPALPFLMAAVVGSMVALFTGDVLYALAIVALIAAGAVVGWAYARRRRG
jgi:hypothetical protein